LAAQRYLVALGSNLRHVRHGTPEQVLQAALKQLPGTIEAVAPWIASAPLGPSRRRYANGAALVRTPLLPDDMLDALQEVERVFGRRSGGQRWSSRVLDLDIVLWSGGAWASPGLVVPHRAFRERRFVLGPAATIAPDWRDPLTGLTLRQLLVRASRARALR
jgi:2-amino-4-hydroxy-6-hydroxymethyldihydropteridine diphosphokinase